MAHYGAMMQQPWANGPHNMNHPHNGPQIADDSQDPKRPQQPVIQVVGDVKPRLTKEQHDILEAHFQQQAKPTTNTKKGFAESLGVPLDKINNWFQNRRAKVKQDIKKQMNAYNMYQQQMAMAQMNNQPAPHAPEYFAANPHLEPSAFHPDPARAPMDPHNPNFSMAPPNPQLMSMLGSIPESHNPASSDDIMHNLAASGYAIDSINISSIAAKPNYMAYDGPQDFMFDLPYQMSTNIQDFGAQFGEMSGNGDGFDFHNFVAGAPMQATQSNGSTPSIPSTLSSVQSTSTMPSSVGTVSVPTLGSTEWSDEHKPTISISQDQQMPQSAYSSPPEDGSSLWTQPQPQQQQHFERRFPSEEIPRPSSSQNLPPTPPDQKPGEFDPHGLPPEALSRRPSSTNGLAESMGNVDIQQRSASMDAEFKQPGTPSSLAARRQRPRPAALGQAALRSASYSAGMPVSPGANANLNPPDQSLRRIRSSGVPGVQCGRIQKSNNGSGQRSPMNLTFAEAAASPKFARHAYATVSSPGSHISLAPPTPLTPNEGARFPSWQSHPSVNTSVDHGSPNGIAVSWTSESPAFFPHAVSSPPETPLDADQAAQYQAYLHNVSMYRDTPPQSAPAHQQSFAAAFPPPLGPPMNENLSVNVAHMAHVRRPSLPENVMVVPHVPILNAPTGDMPLTYQSMPYNRPQYSHPPPPPQPQVTLPSQTTAAFPTPPQPAPPPIPMQHSNLLSADFAVHEYTPPSAQGRAKDSPSPSIGMKEYLAPKVYHFANQGPRDFAGQTA